MKEHYTLFERDLSAHMDEFRVKLHSEVDDLKTKVEGVQERQALTQKVDLLSHKPPPVPYPDPLLQQIPTLTGSVHACMTHLSAVDRKYGGERKCSFILRFGEKKFGNSQNAHLC